MLNGGDPYALPAGLIPNLNHPAITLLASPFALLWESLFGPGGRLSKKGAAAARADREADRAVPASAKPKTAVKPAASTPVTPSERPAGPRPATSRPRSKKAGSRR